MHVCMYVCMHVCTYVCMYVCIYACVYEYYMYVYSAGRYTEYIVIPWYYLCTVLIPADFFSILRYRDITVFSKV